MKAESDSNLPDVTFRLAGIPAPSVVNAVYPIEFMTRLHERGHIQGLTGRWMDTGSIEPGGNVRGSYHRLYHGHHPLEDGIRVIKNSDLKYGQFLHHLGMDFITRRGVPNFLIPTALAQRLMSSGLSKNFVNELITLNLPKILGGSLALVCSGMDVYLAFSDAIPHTFLAAGVHLSLGVLSLTMGLFPPNFLLLSTGAAEIGVGMFTAYNALVDPVIPSLGLTGSVYFPLLTQSLLLAAVLGVCVSQFRGDSWSDMAKKTASTAVAAGTSISVSIMSAGGFLAPFIGPMAGILTFLLAKKVLDSAFPSNLKLPGSDNYWARHKRVPDNYWVRQTREPYSYWARQKRQLYDYWARQTTSQHLVDKGFPLIGLPNEPIGTMKGGRLILNESALSSMATSFMESTR